MLRVTTLYAGSAVASSRYYTQYLTEAVGEEPGRWAGRQAAALGLSGVVSTSGLGAVLAGRDPLTATVLGSDLRDRVLANGRVVRAVAGFDATFSAPKSVSVLWALTGDRAILEVHDQAVQVALACVERLGATTRVRVHGARQFPDTGGLTIAAFRQLTSRADDPQIHTHAVISAKVQTGDGRWWALDARWLKRHQRMLGGLYQSALRAGMAERYGIGWGPVVNGQAEITGIPTEVLRVLSKRAAVIDTTVVERVAAFVVREGRDPSRRERAAIAREVAVDTRDHKSGTSPDTLTRRWRDEAANVGWTGSQLLQAAREAARNTSRNMAGTGEVGAVLTVGAVLDRLSAAGSTWSRAEVLRVVCDLAPMRPMTPTRWADTLDRAVDQIVDSCVDLDPPLDRSMVRSGDGRSVWIEPTATHHTTTTIVAEEEHVVSWVLAHQTADPAPSATVEIDGLDVVQAAAAAAVAGRDRVVLVEGPAGAGKTTMLRAAINDLQRAGRPVFGIAPTAAAARVLQTETRTPADTIAKLLYEHTRPDRGPAERYRLGVGVTVIVDEAGMIGTPTLHQLTTLAERSGWRLVLVGDPHQLQAVGRGGLFAELCATGRVEQLSTIHRFTSSWEAAASVRLRHGDPTVISTYHHHHRLHAAPFDNLLDQLADRWIGDRQAGWTTAITTTTNADVLAINARIQHARLERGDLQTDRTITTGAGERLYVGDVVVTRRNDRGIVTAGGEMVRNRDRWTIDHLYLDGTLTLTSVDGRDWVRLPAPYTHDHVRLGYAGTEHANQGLTVEHAYQVITSMTTGRGCYVGATRGREVNEFLVTADSVDAGIELLHHVISNDCADLPAIVQQRQLATTQPVPPAPDRSPAPWVRVHGVEWVNDWRDRLRQRRVEIAGREAEHLARQAQAGADLNALQPVIVRAEEAWQPFQDRIGPLERQLRDELEPAMWKAERAARAARFGRHHHSARHAERAAQAVGDARAEINAIRLEGRPQRTQLDQFRAQAIKLQDQTRPAMLWAVERELLPPLDRLIEAIDTWTDWNTGHHVSVGRLHDSLLTLTERSYQHSTTNRGNVSGQDIHRLTQPLHQWLTDHHLEPPHRHHQRHIDRGVGLSR